MNRNRGLAMMLVLLGLAGALLWHPVGVPGAPWQLRLEIASVSLSLSGGGAPVQNRTGLFEIGRSLIWMVR